MESKKKNEEIEKFLLLPILGNSGARKSLFFKKALNKLDKDENLELVPSIGLDLGTYETFFKIIDTPGNYIYKDELKHSNSSKILYMAKLYILMYDASDKKSYQTKAFTTWVDLLQEGKKHFKVSKNKNYFFLLGSVDEAKKKNKVDEIDTVLKNLQKMYISKCPNYVFTDLGTIDIIKESPEKILSRIKEFVETYKLRDTIFQKQKTYFSKIMSEKEKELEYYQCTII